MSDLNRLQDETHDESHPAPTPATESAAPAPMIEPGADLTIEPEDSGAGGAPGANGEAPRKKRRRGTRGGQRRKKPAGTAGGGESASAARGDSAAPPDDADLEEAEAMEGSEDWTAASADRGLT